MTRIVDAVLVGNQRTYETAELQQCVPVTAVASQARRLDRDNRADTPVTDGSKQLLKVGPRNAAAAAKIVVDDGDIAPAELLRPVCKLRDDRRRRAAELAGKATAVKKKPGPGPGSRSCRSGARPLRVTGSPIGTPTSPNVSYRARLFVSVTAIRCALT
jgi:hypothetical protein